MYTTFTSLNRMRFLFPLFCAGNIALKRLTKDSENSIKGSSPTNDGNPFSCLSEKRKLTSWNVKFGDNVRVAVVFVLHSEKSYIYRNKRGLKIQVESFNKEVENQNAGNTYSASILLKTMVFPDLCNVD